jgi:CO/xanthine dehydrogenase Mo-binding subunit
MSNFSIIGKPIALVDSAGKTTGQGKYADDLSMPGMLIGGRSCIRTCRTRS